MHEARYRMLPSMQVLGCRQRCHMLHWVAVAGAHERPRASGSFRMSTMTAFWYLAPMPTMPVISCL